MYITVYSYTHTDIHSSSTRSTPPSCQPAPYRATGRDTPDYSSFPPHCTLIYYTCHAYVMYITVYSYTHADIHSSNTRSTPPSCQPVPYHATGKDTPDYSSFPPHYTLIHYTCHAYAMYTTVYSYTHADMHSSNTRSTPPSCRPAPYPATGKDTPDYSSFPPHCTLIYYTCHAYAMYITVYSYTHADIHSSNTRSTPPSCQPAPYPATGKDTPDYSSFPPHCTLIYYDLMVLL